MLERALTGRLCAGFSNAGATSLFMRFPGVATSATVGLEAIRATSRNAAKPAGADSELEFFKFPHFHSEVQHQAVSAAERVAETA